MQQNRKIILLGAGGHCRSVADSLIGLSCYDDIGLVGKEGTDTYQESNMFGLCEIGKDNQLEELFRKGYKDAFITVGSIGDCTTRKMIYEKLKRIGFHIPNIIDKSSVVSNTVYLMEGIYVGKNAVVNAYANIGNCAIINTSCVIEHESSIGDFAHIAPGSIVCGNVMIGEGTHIGAGSTILQGIQIGRDTMIGMGSVVLRDIGNGVTAYGNPCREKV